MEKEVSQTEPGLPEAEESGLSLDELSQAFAKLMDRGGDPSSSGQAEPEEAAEEDEDSPLTAAHHACCPVSPLSILEAMLFVGCGQNDPLTAEVVASRIRGVEPEEVEELVRELNEQYTAEEWAYEIESVHGGYRLVIRDDYFPLRENFYQKLRESRLSQAAIDCLAVVAYHQPLTRPQIEEFRDRPSGAVLRQLVRRELLVVEKVEGDLLYRTTARFWRCSDWKHLPNCRERKISIGPCKRLILQSDRKTTC